MEISTATATLRRLISWKDESFGEIEIPNNQRNICAAGLIDLSLEHEKAICVLSEHTLYGSALALLRPLFESYLRGVWLLRVARSPQIDQFVANEQCIRTYLTNIKCVVADIEGVDGYDTGTLKWITEKHWPLMCDFTHGGISQSASRYTSDVIQPNYPLKQIFGATYFTAMVGLLASAEQVHMSGNVSLYPQIEDKMNALRQESWD